MLAYLRDLPHQYTLRGCMKVLTPPQSCRHLQARVMKDMQQLSSLTPADPRFSHEVATLQKVLLGAMVIHPNFAVLGVVSAISNPDVGIAHAARALLESVVLPIALQETHHLNGSTKPHGLLSSLPADSFSPLSFQQCLRTSLKSAFHGTHRQQSCRAHCHAACCSQPVCEDASSFASLHASCPEHHLGCCRLAAEVLHR